MAAEKYGRLGRENGGLGFRRWPALVLWRIIQPQRGLHYPNSNKIKIFQHQITSKASPPSSYLLTLRWFYSQWSTNGEWPQSITLKSRFLALGAPACRHKDPNARFHPRNEDAVKGAASWIKAGLLRGWGGQPAERACHPPVGHACALHQQVYKYVSCFTPPGPWGRQPRWDF